MAGPIACQHASHKWGPPLAETASQGQELNYLGGRTTVMMHAQLTSVAEQRDSHRSSHSSLVEEPIYIPRGYDSEEVRSILDA